VLLAVPAAGFDFSEFDFDKIVDNYNMDIDNVPWIVKTVAGTERINIQVRNADGSISTLGIETRDGSLVAIKEGVLADPTMVIEMNADQMTEMMESENPLMFIAESLKDKTVEVEAKSFWMMIKLFIADIIFALFGIAVTVGNYVKPLG